MCSKHQSRLLMITLCCAGFVSMSFLKSMFFSKPEKSSTPIVSKKLNGILRKGNLQESLDTPCNDTKCNNCSEHQSATISLSDNSGEESDSCISCRSSNVGENSRTNSKRVSFNSRVKKCVFLSDANERTRTKASEPTVRHSIHAVPSTYYSDQPRYIMCSRGPHRPPGPNSHSMSSQGTIYFRIM